MKSTSNPPADFGTNNSSHALRMGLRILAALSVILATVICAEPVDAQILIDYDDGIANGIHDASILNGGFEDVLVTAGSAGDRLQYDEVPNWTNVGGPDQTFDFVRTNLELTSDQNAVLSDNPARAAGIDTGHNISFGELFDFSYAWRDASAWVDTDDQVAFTLFTTVDDTLNGAVFNSYQFLSGVSTANATYETVSSSFVATEAADVGKRLFVSIGGVDGGGGPDGFARLDDVFLQVGPKPSNLFFWTNDGSGSWNDGGNWDSSPAFPNATNADVRLTGSAITAPSTVNIASSVTVNNLQMDGSNQFDVTSSPGQSLTLAQDGANDPSITVTSGTHVVSASVAGSAGLTKAGAGTLVLSGTNSYTGGTTIQGGTLATPNVTSVLGPVSVDSGATLAFVAGANGTFSNNLSGAGGVSLADADITTEVVTLTGSNSGFSGTISIDGNTATTMGALRAGVNDAFGSSSATVDVRGSFVTAEISGGVSLGNQWVIGSRAGNNNPGAENDPHINSISGSNSISGNISGEGDSLHIIGAEAGSTLTINNATISDTDETGTFKFVGDGNITIGNSGTPGSGRIVGTSANVVKQGSGTLTIATSEASTDTTNATGSYWGGTTSVEGGTMAVIAGVGNSGELASSVINVGSGAVFDVSSFGTYNLQVGQSIGGSGTIDGNGTTTLGYFDDGFLVPGDDVGTLTIDGNLSLSTFNDSPAGAITFELGSSTAVGGSDNDLVSVGNNLTLSQGAETNQFQLNVVLVDGVLATGSSYTLFQAGNLIGNSVTGADFNVSLANAQGTTLQTRQSATVAVNEGSDEITLTASGSSPLNLTFSGGNGAWDVANSANWNASSEQFFDLDSVTFNDSSSTFAVNVINAVSPSSTTFSNSSNDYTLTGDGIEGSGTLVKNGTGTVTLSNDGNSFTGGVQVNSGRLVLDGDTTAFSGGVTVASGATLDVGVSANGTDKNVLPDEDSHGGIAISGGGNVRVFDGERFDAISGSGSLSFEEEASDLGNNTGYDGNITVRNGAEAELLFASSLGTTTGTTTVEAGGRLFVDDTATVDINSNEALSLAGFGRSGTEGALQVGGVSTHTFGGNITLTGDTRFRVGNSSGVMNVTGPVNGSGSSASLTLSSQGTMNVSGPVSLGTGGINATGTGTVNLSGATSYSGDTNIEAGTLALSGSATLSASPNITVAAGATLDVQGIGTAALNNQNLTVEGDVIGNVNATNGSSVIVNSNNSLQGNLTSDASAVSGVGTVVGNVTASNGSTVSPGGAITVDVQVSQDARIQSGAATTTYNTSRIGVGLTQTDGIGRGLVEFDLAAASIPAGSTVTGGDLVLRVGFDWGPAVSQNVTIEAHEVTTDWEELGQSGTTDGSGGVTWNLAVDPNNGQSGEPGESAWTNPGGDFNATVLGDSGVVDPDAVGGGTIITVSGANLDASVLANLANGSYDLILKLDDASEAVASDQFNAIWFDTNSNGPMPAVLRLDVFDPTSTLTVSGDYSQNSGSILDIDIASTTDFDKLDVGGALAAGGTLNIDLLAGFSPSLGDTFDILDFASASGGFSFDLPSLGGGLGWDISNVLTTGVLEVVNAVDVDVDNDGDVDGSDFLSLQRTNPALIPAWQAQYGTQSPLLASAAVPEPGSLILLTASLSALLLSRERRWSLSFSSTQGRP